jgi:hypothetical protein
MQACKSVVWFAAILVVAAAGWVGLVYDGPGGAMTQAAQGLLESLSSEQRAKASFGYDDPERLNWHYIPRARKGLSIKEMNAAQRRGLHALLHAGLSETGHEKATAIMSLEAILHQLEKDRKGGPVRDPELYFVSIFGKPAPKGQWGWRIEGHHLSLNFAVRDGELAAATPAFFGANPATIMAEIPGQPVKKGARTLAKEEQLAFDLLGSLNEEQFKSALIGDKAPSDLRSPNTPQPPSDAAVGLVAEKMTPAQSKTLWSLLEAYAGNMPQEVGQAWLGEIQQSGAEKVHFAWSGASKPGTGHYYRLQGPTFLVEFVNVQPDSANNPANHIHSVWRSMAGDFGIAL